MHDDKYENCTVAIWEVTYQLRDENGDDVLNEDGTVKLFRDCGNVDFSAWAEWVEPDMLEEIDTSKTKTIFVIPEIGHKLEKWCDHPPSDVGKGEVLFDEEVQFGDGYRMAIQAIASLDPSSEPIWTQGVLFTPDGVEAGNTDVGESFWGEFQVGDYTCLVKPATPEEMKNA